MDINIILRINPSLKGNIGSITKELGNYQFTIDDKNTPFLHLKKMYLETLFNDEDNISFELLMMEDQLNFRFFNESVFLDDRILLKELKSEKIIVWMDIKDKEILFRDLELFITKNDIFSVLIGGNIIENRNIEERLDVNPKYKGLHDLFRQQLPLPILINAMEEKKSLKIILIDPGYNVPQIFEKIDSLKSLKYHKKDIIISYEDISLNVLFNDIFLDDQSTDAIVSFIVIQSNINIESYKEILSKLYDNDYYLYLGTLSITKDALITNDTNVDDIIQWHGK